MQKRIEAESRKNAKLAGTLGQAKLIEEVKTSEVSQGSGYGLDTEVEQLFQSKKIIDHQDAYHLGRLRRGRALSPERPDVFKKPDQKKAA
jgi:hypothetical protein